MTRGRYKYVTSDIDRHGNVRFYFRRKGQKKIRIYGRPGGEEFEATYASALAGLVEAKKQTKRTAIGSFGDVCLSYYASPEYKALDPATRRQRQFFLDAICKVDGEKPMASLKSHHVRRMIENRRNTPAAARNLLNSIKALFKWAVSNRKVGEDVAQGLRPFRYSTKGHATWSAEHVTAFEQRHPVGSQARLAMTLLLYSGCRREDVVRLGPPHIAQGRLRYTQAKNEHRHPVRIDMRMHPTLRRVIAASRPFRHMTFLVTAQGKAFTAAGFGNKFRQWCNEAGLQGLSSHGLRKTLATQMAEAGATPHQIMAVTGHRSLSEVERYTREANKGKLADAGIAKLKSRT